MTAPCDPETPAEPPREEEQEIFLRLGDILPRVPSHLVKPGAHDMGREIRFSVDELAEKIARGRVTVPVERLSSALPEVFETGRATENEVEIPLPLQKLLEKVGLVVAARPPAANSMPPEQLEQARAQANRIIETTSAAQAEEAALPSLNTLRIGRALATARQILGRFARSNYTPPAESKEAPAPAQSKEKAPEPAETATPVPVPAEAAAETGQTPETPKEKSISVRVLPIFRLLPGRVLKVGTLPTEEARVALPLAAIDPQLAGGHVEIPVEDFVQALPEELARMLSPVPDFKVWIPLVEIFQNLPEDHLFFMPPIGEPEAGDAAPTPGAPKEETAPETASEEKNAMKAEAEKPVEEVKKAEDRAASEPAPSDRSAEPAAALEAPAAKAIPGEDKATGATEPAEQPADAENKGEPEPADKPSASQESPTPQETPMIEPSQPTTIEPDGRPEGAPKAERTETESPREGGQAQMSMDPAPESVASEEVSDPQAGNAAPVGTDTLAKAQPEPEKIAVAVSEGKDPPAGAGAPLPEAEVPSAQSPTPNAEAENGASEDSKPGPESGAPARAEAVETINPEPPQAETSPAPAEPISSRAPWMRGFQVPPPRLFHGSVTPASTPEPVPAEPALPDAQPAAQAAMPEAKRTADILTKQPGIFAAAAFVEGAVFASEDFPRKPDLDALRDFMGVFVETAFEIGKRLGWNRVLTIACEDFYVTAVVRETHFIAALHRERALASTAYDALIEAGDGFNPENRQVADKAETEE